MKETGYECREMDFRADHSETGRVAPQSRAGHSPHWPKRPMVTAGQKIMGAACNPHRAGHARGQRKRCCEVNLILLALGLCAVVCGQSAQPPRAERRPDSPPPVRYYYRFENPKFDVPLVELEIDSLGKGHFSFRRKDAGEVVRLPLELLPQTLRKIQSSLEALRFLESTETYQGERDASYLGTATLGVVQGGRERRVTFNFTRNEVMRDLAGLLRAITLQEYRVFLIELARRHEPLDLDKQLLSLEAELKNGWLAEPEKLLPLLRRLRDDDDILLMARRRADRLVRQIEKTQRGRSSWTSTGKTGA